MTLDLDKNIFLIYEKTSCNWLIDLQFSFCKITFCDLEMGSYLQRTQLRPASMYESLSSIRVEIDSIEFEISWNIRSSELGQ